MGANCVGVSHRNRGAPGQPITGADIETKFMRNALELLTRSSAALARRRAGG